MFDKTNWEKVKFGNVAIQKKKNVDRETTELTKYIKGEHMNSEDLHIREWGDLKDEYLGPAFHRLFEKGDILYGSRRTYLRKVAIAEFDGITSNTTFTIDPNEEAIIPNLLPFIMLSEGFAQHSIKNSKGSVNPYINWKDIASYEFLLPPIDQQAKIAELLWAMDDVVEREKESLIKYSDFYKVFLFDSIAGKMSNDFANWKTYTLGDLGESYGGLSGKSKKDFGSGKPFINYMNIFTNSKIKLDQVDYVELTENENQNKIKYGDIFLTGSSETPEEVGMSSVLLDDVKEYYLNSFCFGFRLHNFETLLPQFARFLLRGYHVRKFMFKHAQGSTRFNLSKTTVKDKLKIKLPTVIEQEEIATKLDIMENRIAQHQNKINQSIQLQKSLINEMFSS